ncbi:unnamed protein product [Didymodactylos carnosus]|uniref:Sec1-like protein n=1 Tax=Didymodactylos carnosus TaxID=1234261 RepID=A0A813P4E8_9BILA|nr:unnamed protein product [Didymodactylos carnosus]CAF3523519.1 unnamed protein product [Didymodactylos carnosus]
MSSSTTTSTSSAISLSLIQSQSVTALCKLCSNSLVLIDHISAEWLRITNASTQLLSTTNVIGIQALFDQNFFTYLNDENVSRIVFILSEILTRPNLLHLQKLCCYKQYESVLLLLCSPTLVHDSLFDENIDLSTIINEHAYLQQTLEKKLFDGYSSDDSLPEFELKYIRYPCVTITQQLFLIPALTQYKLPTIETITQLNTEKIKGISSVSELFRGEDVKFVKIHTELLNSLMSSLDGKEDLFSLGPLSQLIAKEYTQSADIRQRRKNCENKLALLLIDRQLDLGVVTSHTQDTLLSQIIHLLPNVRTGIKNTKRTIDVIVDCKSLLKTNFLKSQSDFNGYLFGDIKRTNDVACATFDNIIYSKTKIATSEIFTRLLEALIYNNLETKVKAAKVSAAAISMCLEKFKQSPSTVVKCYELLILSSCLMHVMDNNYELQKLDRLSALEKIIVQSIGSDGPSAFSIILQALKEELIKPVEQRQLKLDDFLILILYVYSLSGDDCFYGKEEKERTHKMIGKEILNDTLFTNKIRQNLDCLGYSYEKCEHMLNEIYQRLDLLASVKRKYKYFNSLIVRGNDQQPSYRHTLLKQIFESIKRIQTTVPSTSSSRLSASLSAATSQNMTSDQQQLLQDIEYTQFDGLRDFFKNATRGFFGDTKPTLASYDYSTIVIFIVGGITTNEIQLVQEYSVQLKKQVKRDCLVR